MLAYRREIDGLRALAVLPVMVFHAGFGFVPGGFTGVDVFFVISGYLITALILKEQGHGTFSLAGFYERRMRRILPAMFLVIFCSLLAAWLLMLPPQIKDFGRALMGASSFSYNFQLAQRVDYFAEAAELKPLLHLWSLGVEEQFYTLFPLAMLLLATTTTKRKIALLTVVGLASLALAQWSDNFDGSRPDWFSQAWWAGFYMPTGRLWELLAGGLVALYLADHPGRHMAWRSAAGLAGIAMIVASYLVYTKDTPFPSIYTVLPVGGTVLVLLYATPATLAGKLLSLRPLVAVGMISYSAYLWHQPVLVFARLAVWPEPHLSLLISGALVLLALVLAVISWQYVEKPFRDRRFLSQRHVFAWSLAASLCCFAMGAVLVASDGAEARYAKKDRYLLGIDAEALATNLEARFNTYRGTQALTVVQPRLFHAAPGQRKIAVIGDSMAEDFVNLMAESGHFDNAQIRTHLISMICQIMPDEAAAERQRDPTNIRFCRKQGGLALAMPLVRQADVVVVATWWLPWSMAQLPATIQAMHLRSDQRLVIVGKKSFGLITPRTYLPLTDAQRIALRQPPPADMLSDNEALKRIAGASYLDLEGPACPDQAGCPVFTPEGRLISFDSSHLTPEGVHYVVQRVNMKF